MIKEDKPIYKNAGRPAEGCLYSAHIVQLEILGQQQAQVCFGLGHKAAGLVEDGLLHFVAGQPPVACVRARVSCTALK